MDSAWIETIGRACFVLVLAAACGTTTGTGAPLADASHAGGSTASGDVAEPAPDVAPDVDPLTTSCLAVRADDFECPAVNDCPPVQVTNHFPTEMSKDEPQFQFQDPDAAACVLAALRDGRKASFRIEASTAGGQFTQHDRVWILGDGSAVLYRISVEDDSFERLGPSRFPLPEASVLDACDGATGEALWKCLTESWGDECYAAEPRCSELD